MNARLQRHVNVHISRSGALRRRDFFKSLSAAALAGGALGFADRVAYSADELRRRGKACILLYMQGGPSQFETFSPKPDHDNGGGTRAISTSVPGIEVSENLPGLAREMHKLAVIRSMTSREGSHPRAQFLTHTGYLPVAGVKYPSFGSLCSREIAHPACELPAFVRIGQARLVDSLGGGFLGVEHDPFQLRQAGALPDNARPTTSSARYQRRLGLLQRLEDDYAAEEGKQVVADHRKLYRSAARMILSPQMQAFDLEREPAAVRDAYGRTPFGSGCLLARRLVESGVAFVEIMSGGWDTHADNFNRVRQRTGEIDGPFARLLADLESRGLLDSTLVVWMGEFGRTPRVNPRDGRDHYPRAFNVALAGGGVRGGRVVGATDAGGESVTDRPVTVPDLFRTFCRALEIDADQENMSAIGRPIRVVDGGQTIDELFS